MSRARRTKPKPHIALRITGVVGELMITLGVVVGLFVVWQLWWTDVQAGRAQASAIESLGWTEPEPLVVPPEEIPDAEPTVMAPPEDGSTFATIYVPRFGPDYQVTIAEGVGKKEILDTGAIGHYPETALPGEIGNFALAGHRTTYGKPLNQVAELQLGDPIIVRTADTWYVYTVTESLIVLPPQVEVIQPIPGTMPGEVTPAPTERFITLTTCHPMFSARERFIVHGTFSSWMPVSQGTPAELAPPGGQ